jgi:para-nitrobenzyl esterase
MKSPALLLLLVLVSAQQHGRSLAWERDGGQGAREVLLETPSGNLLGTQFGVVREFVGIPYAAPPVGALRWRPPRRLPSPAWNGTWNATAAGASCVQMGTPFAGEPCVDYKQVTSWRTDAAAEAGGDARYPMQSEDCLFLNVWAPVPRNHSHNPVCSSGSNCTVCSACCHDYISPGADCRECTSVNCANASKPGPSPPRPLLPVMVWIHGGSYEGGSGHDFNGSSILELTPSVVVVTLNYRLNVFGFLGSAQLQNAPGGDGSTGTHPTLPRRHPSRDCWHSSMSCLSATSHW